MITVSSLKLGVVSTALKDGTGSAYITPSGDYTGAIDREYVIETVASGEIGIATFRWSDDGGVTWEASGVVTSTNPIELNNGVFVKWTAGAGTDIGQSDKWYFKGINLYNPGKMLDMDRDSRYRSLDKTLSQTITIVLADAVHQVDAIVIGDHNFTAANITVEFASNAAFDADYHIETIPWVAGTILYYLTHTTLERTKQYWRFTFAATTTSDDAYFEIGELYLGSYTALSKTFRQGFTEEPNLLMDNNFTSYGVGRSRFYNEMKSYTYNFLVPTADVVLKKALVSALGSGSTGVFKPFWFNIDPVTPSDVILARLISWPHTHNVGDYYDMPLQLTEVIKSV